MLKTWRCQNFNQLLSVSYNNVNPTDLIRHKVGGTYVIDFDSEVTDLYMVVVSLGRPNGSYVTYDLITQ